MKLDAMSRPPARSVPSKRRGRKPGPPLALKKRPAQQRATETFERVLEAAAQALADVGFDRLSTNVICRRAGLTPPALYRYFPNKYAVLCELGRRLMLRQNALIDLWITSEALEGGEGALPSALQGLMLDTYRLTSETVGGAWITRALRAVPALSAVRLASHRQVTEEQTRRLRKVFPQAAADELRTVSRVTVELLYSAVEMLFDEPSLDVRAVSTVISSMVASYRLYLKE
jgi:AcrR family transcriptional regulator